MLKPVPVQVRPWAPSYFRKMVKSNESYNGELAQLVRASALQAGGHKFESCIAHHFFAEIAQLVEQLTCNQ